MKDTLLPLVSIVIPTYNNATYIADAIRSAISQDYQNLEIIVIDDASNDNTADIVKVFTADPRVRYYKNDQNVGRVANYHKGLYDIALGEWYLNLDGDDYLTDHSFISNAISWSQIYTNVVMITGGAERLVNGKLHYTICSKYNDQLSCIDGKTYFLDLLSEKAYFIHLATLYNRTKAIALNFYSENIISTDYESLYRLVLTGNIVCYKKLVGVWRIHGGNESSRTIFSVKDLISNFKFIENAASFGYSFLPRESIKNWRKQYLIKIIESYILQVLLSKPKNGLVVLFSLIRKYPLLFLISCKKIVLRNSKKIFKSA